MKTRITLLVFVLFSGLIMNAQAPEAPQTTMPVITKIAATWCPPCGGWGWDFFEHALNDNESNAVLMAVHHSGDLVNPTASSLTANLNASSQPRFYLNKDDQNVSSSNANAKRTELHNAIATIAAAIPDVQTGIDASWNGDKLNVEYKAEFFKNSNGDFQLAFYVVEKLVVGSQAGQGSNAQHEQILRTEVTGNHFGTPLASGSIDSGETYSGTFSMNLGTYNPENLEIVGIIYDKVGSSYNIVNANKDSDVQEKIITDIKDPISEISFSFDIYSTDDNIWNLNVSESINKAEINIYNLSGTLIETLYEGPLSAENNTIIKAKNLLPSGLYLINLYSEIGMVTKKVFVK